MNNDNMTPATPVMPATPNTPPPEDAPALVKKIGKMTYIVRVHFSTTSKETFVRP